MTLLPKIYLSLAQMGGEEQNFIQQAFDTNWVVPLGPNVDGFEGDLERFLGVEPNRVVALNSGTAAIHLALIQLGVQPCDEVICQSFTFAASANPIRYLGAHPVFIDSEADSWNMDPELLERAIRERISITGKRPKAIIPVHLYGMPARMDEISRIAALYNIPVLEDAAEAMGSGYKGQICGTFGEFACLSFNGNKMITTSGGGALVCSRADDADTTRFLATQARDEAPHYRHSQVGYNYRLSNICAGIGRGQMLVVDQHISARRAINEKYREILKELPGVTFLENPSHDFDSNHWLTCILIEPAITGYTREDIRQTMDAANIETRPLWKPMHLQPVYAHYPFYTKQKNLNITGTGTLQSDNSICGQLFRHGLCLPSHPGLTDGDIQRVVKQIKNNN